MCDLSRRDAVKLATVGAAVVMAAGTAMAAGDEPRADAQPELSEAFKKMLETRDIVGPLQTPDGQTGKSITVATGAPGQTQSKTEDWAFIVPAGYVRYSGNFERTHHSGDVAQCDWANGNPADGTVHAYVKASQYNGYARAAANNLYAITPSAAARLYAMSVEAAKKRPW